MKNKSEEILKKIQKARIQILMKMPFFGILSLKLNIVEDLTIDTAGVDGINLYYNPDFIEKLPSNELNWVLIHEVMHCALRHLWRRGNRNAHKWNVACDYAIHAIMHGQNSQYMTMPEGCLYNSIYDNMSAEQIYEELPMENENQNTFDDHSIWNKKGNGSSKSENGNSKSENGNNNAENGNDKFENGNSGKELEKKWTDNVVSAAKATENSKESGSMPGFFSRMIENITNPVKDWRILLREFIEPECNDYTFIRPDYRIDYDSFGCFMPSFNDEQEKVSRMMFWVDTSGSISDIELEKIYSEVAGVFSQFDYFEGWLGFFDSVAYEPTPFNNIKELRDIKPKGGGGTSFHAPFEYLQEHEIDVRCNIILTDGYCDYPDESITDVPTIWMITTKDKKAPWGRSIYLPLNDNE